MNLQMLWLKHWYMRRQALFGQISGGYYGSPEFFRIGKTHGLVTGVVFRMFLFRLLESLMVSDYVIIKQAELQPIILLIHAQASFKTHSLARQLDCFSLYNQEKYQLYCKILSINIQTQQQARTMDQKKQAQMKQQIAAFMRRKDYYDVLGVQKTAQLIQIKKAYKKLALRFHPDKNRVEGAKQVFKKVSNAYTTLSNAEKRQRYDRYGPQDNQPPPRQRGYAYRGGRDQQFDQFDQVFRAFFGGGNIRFNQNQYQNFFFHTGGPRQHPQQPRQQQGTFNFGWIFFVFIMIYMVSPLFKSKPQFQLTPSAEYRFKQGTPLLSAPYYVKQSFFSSVKNDANLKKSIDQTVDHNFVLKLDQACDSSTRIKKSYQRQGYYYGAGATRQAFLRKAAQVDMSACIRLQEIKQNHGDYIRNLFYYY